MYRLYIIGTILFSKSFTNISYFTPDVNSNFKFDKKLHF